MLCNIKKIAKSIFASDSSLTVYPYHTYRENNTSYMERHLEEEEERSRDPYIFVNNINNNDIDITEEYNVEGFVYYNNLEYIGRDPIDSDGEEEYTRNIPPFTFPKYLDDSDSDIYNSTSKSSYFTVPYFVRKSLSQLYYSPKHKYRFYFTMPKVYMLTSPEKKVHLH